MGIRSAFWLRVALFVLSATSACPLHVVAQEGSVAGLDGGDASDPVDPPDSPDAPSLQAPRLLQGVEATYPEAARAAGLGAVVPLRLTIDVDGKVIEAEVIEPQGHGFDEAARAAALLFNFEPARKDGVALRARIVYRYTFAIAAPPEPATPAPTPTPQTPTAPRDETVDVVLQGSVDVKAAMERSAESVDVVDIERLRARALDMGDVLARTEGVVVRRAGALGSELRLSLDGLDESRVRYFVDSVPMELMGYLLGPQSATVDLVSRMEVYRGVVPIRFGADTLGGAIHYVTDEALSSTARASYELSSFNTHRVMLSARYHLEPQHFAVRGQASFDYSDNDYPIDVEIADARGRLSPVTVDRFHDAYTAQMAWLEAGFFDAPWIKRLSLRMYGSGYDKDLQHNVVMTVPYGEARYGGSAYGATLRLAHEDLVADNTEIDAVFNISRSTVDFNDTSKWVYNWRGERVRERQRAGETSDQPIHVIQWQTAVFDRIGFKWSFADDHALQLVTAHEYTTRTGDDRLQTMGRDAEHADRDYFTAVSGAEWQAKLWDDRIENQLFVKHYWLNTSSEEELPGGTPQRRDRDQHLFGIGNGVRLMLASSRWLWLKASYERAAQLPEAYQIFGDGVLVRPNLNLVAESSHNANLALYVDWKQRDVGRITGNVRGFVRWQDNLILLLGNDRNFMYQNVYEVLTVGTGLSAQWESVRQYATLNGSITLQQLSNNSSEGAFAGFKGDMLPNRPWLFANAGASGRLPKLFVEDDALLAGWDVHYTQWYFRGWESQGDPRFKQKIPTQIVNDVYVTYEVESALKWSVTLEMQNLFDALVFEQFGAQRPGRSLSLKLAAEL